MQPEWTPPELLPDATGSPHSHAGAAAVPQWQHPCEPGPCGFLRSTSATILFDVSGTLSHRLNGRFADEIAAVAALLDPVHGEMLTQQAFDVIAFAAGAHSWSLAKARQQRTLDDSTRRCSGRAVRFCISAICINAWG